MVIGLLRLELRLPDCQSLKGKRQLLLSLKTRMKNRLNVAVSEVDQQDKWQAATLAVVSVGTDQPGVNRVLSYVSDLVEQERSIELLDAHMEFF
ncbi:MAG: DUF503 domain-containing protein [Candidatus Omnitrophica bacterium]|nr:DUF503 domain-containing protein [Candidatus Omnitrophota bacterium]